MIKENQIVGSNPYIENVLKSNSATLKFFVASNLGSLQDELMEIISNKTFLAKMSLLFKYYKPRGNEDISTIANKKILNKFGMTKILSDIINSVADNLNLHLDQAFELLEIYCQSDIEELEKLLKREEYMKIIENDPNTALQFTSSNIAEFQTKFKHLKDNFQVQILDIYYEERINLLKLCHMFMTISLKGQDPISVSCCEVFYKLNKNNEILKNLWEIFKTYTAEFRLCKTIEDMQSKEKHSLQILKEQADILDNMMFLTLKTDRMKMTKEMLLDMLFTFTSKQFMGYFYEIANEHHIEEFHRRQQVYAEMLIDQSLLLILYNLDLKYLFNFDNKIKIHNDPDLETLNLERLPFSLFKTDVEKLVNFFEKYHKSIYITPIYVTFISVFNIIRQYIRNGIIKDSQLNATIAQLNDKDIMKYTEDKKYTVSMQNSVDFMNSMFNRVILSKERLVFHSVYKFVIRFWLNIVIKYYLNYEYDLSLIQLCVKTLDDDDIMNIIYWTVDEPYETPIAMLYANIMVNFPENFDMLLLFSNAIKGNKSTSLYSGRIFEKLSSMEHFNLQCIFDDVVENIENNTVMLRYPKITEWGLIIPEETQGAVVKKTTQYYQVRLNYKFSLFDLLYNRWASLIEILYELTSQGTLNVTDLKNKDENLIVKFVSLFCSLISENNSNLDMFFSLLINKENDKEYYITEDEILGNYKKLLSFCFETLSLLTKNWQVYGFLSELSNSIYRLIVSFLHNPLINSNVLAVINQNFISNFQGMSRGELCNQNINLNIPNKRGQFTNVGFPKSSPVMINLIEIFGRTISYDTEVRNFENTVLVLKIVKHFFRYPNIFGFLKNLSSTEFLYNLWQYIVVEFMKTLFSSENFTTRIEFFLCKELMKLIYNNLAMISKSNCNKANIVLVDPDSINLLHELLINCMNLSEASDLIQRIIRTKVVIDQREALMKDKISISNYLWDNFILSGNNFYIDKIEAKNLIRVAFECLNQLFDLLLIYKTTTDENTRKLYSRIDSIKYWDDIFFVNKVIPYFESFGTENFSINLILSVFSYVDFEDKVLLDFQHRNKNFLGDEQFDMDDNQDTSKSKFLKFDELIAYRKKDDKDYNICTLSISTLNRIIVLFKLQAESPNTNINQEFNPTQISKSSNLVNYLYIKKENSSELENSINLFDKYKEKICHLMLKPFNYQYKVAIIKMLTQCAAYQPNFISLFFEEIKIRNLKSKKFWEIFGYLVSAKVPHQSGNLLHLHQNHIPDKQEIEIMGYLTILLSSILANDIIFKKIIKDLLSTFKSDFNTFLNKSIELFSLTEIETKLKTTRKSFKDNMINMNTKCNYFVSTEEDFTEACYYNIVNKSLSIIFSKLILISDHSDKLASSVLKFNYHKELMKFLNGNLSNFIDAYSCRINHNNLNNLNVILANEQSFNNFYGREDESMNRSRHLGSYSKYNQNYNLKENAINIKNIEKIITNNDDKYYLPFTIDPHKGVFNYSFNYWIDMKELYVEMKIRNYNMEIFTDYLSSFIEHNLELSLFEAKTQTMYSVSYLLGLIFSIGIGNNFMSSYFFTGHKVYNLMNRSSQNKEFSEQLLTINNINFPKLGFNMCSEISLLEFVKFIDDKIIKKIQWDLSFYNSSGGTEFANRESNSVRTLQNFNFYNQYQAYKFNITNFVFDYCIYLFNNRDEKNSANISVSIFQKHGIKILEEINRHFCSFLDFSSQFEIEKCILSIVNLVFTLMTYLNVTDYEFQEADVICINNIMSSLMQCYDRIPAYQAIIIYIIKAYSSINYFTSEKNKNNQLNILINTEDNRLIRILLKKLSTNITEQEYLAIITLLISLVDKYDQTLEIIVKDKIMLVFQLNDKFTNSHTINEYQENERGENHILWCWTLIFLRQVCLKIIDVENGNLRFYSIYHSVVDFILNHDTRFMNVLCNSDYFDNSGNHIHKSLAFLEELEYMSSLINSLFYQAKRWKHTSQIYLDFHNRIVSVILSKTLKLYSPNIRIANHYKCTSSIEKSMNEIYATDAGVGIPKHKDERMENATRDEHFTTTFSPLKRSLRSDNIGPVSSFSSRKESFSTSRSLNYNTMVSTMFFYRVDQVLTKVLFNLTNTIKSAVIHDNFSNKVSYLYYMKELYGSKGQSGAIKYFDEQCQNLVYALYYTIHTLDISIKNLSILENLDKKSIIFFNNINSSVSFGNLNLIYNEGRFDDIFHLNNCTIQNIMLVNMNFNQLINFFRSTLSYSFDTQLKDVTLKKIGLIEKLMKERDSKIESFKDFADLNLNVLENVKTNLD